MLQQAAPAEYVLIKIFFKPPESRIRDAEADKRTNKHSDPVPDLRKPGRYHRRQPGDKAEQKCGHQRPGQIIKIVQENNCCIHNK